MIQSHLAELLNERGMGMREFSRAVDYRLSSIRSLYHNRTERFPRELLERTCDYLDVDISDIITFEKDK